MAELLWVQPGRADGRVALSERHDAHPGGEVWVASTGVPVQVAMTPLVERKLDSGDLVRVDAPAPLVKPKPQAKTREEVEAMVKAAGGHVSADTPDAPAVPRRKRKAKGK